MTERAISDPNGGIDDFLIAEYEHFAESFWRTEELGEKRLNFFISLLTAAVAGLVVLATSDSGFSSSQVQWVSFAAGLALLLLGISTLLRMLRRDDVTDEYKGAMKEIRRIFCDRHALQGYTPFQGSDRPFFTGGLAQTAALLNSMIAGALTAIGLVSAASPAWFALAAGLVAGLGLAAQLAYIQKRRG